jgi:hypothetical protein
MSTQRKGKKRCGIVIGVSSLKGGRINRFYLSAGAL